MKRCGILRLACARGTASTKTRHEVSGSGKKLWKQKGTGRARMGSIRSPLWRHGGTTHGPQPRDYSYQLPRKMQLGALRSALSAKLRDGELKVVNAFSLADHKTKNVRGRARQAARRAKTVLLVDNEDNRNLQLGARNLRRREAGVQPRRDRVRPAEAHRMWCCPKRPRGNLRRRSQNDDLRSNQTPDRDGKGRRQERRRAHAVL